MQCGQRADLARISTVAGAGWPPYDGDVLSWFRKKQAATERPIEIDVDGEGTFYVVNSQGRPAAVLRRSPDGTQDLQISREARMPLISMVAPIMFKGADMLDGDQRAVVGRWAGFGVKDWTDKHRVALVVGMLHFALEPDAPEGLSELKPGIEEFRLPPLPGPLTPEIKATLTAFQGLLHKGDE